MCFRKKGMINKMKNKKKNNKKNKNILLIVIFFVIILICTIGYLIINKKNDDTNLPKEEKNEVVDEYIKILEEGKKQNNSTKLKETKKIEKLEISNIQLTYAMGQSVILADVVNTSDEKTELMKVKIIFLDKLGNKLTEINGGIIDTLQPGASTQLNMAITTDCANAYDFTIEKIEE